MRSVEASPITDDRTTPARIRDAAITVIAARGLADSTVRKIAQQADVSPGLVIHHFGSMDDLRLACDKHVAATVRQVKAAALTSGPSFDILGAMRASPFGSMIGYLAEVLTDASPTVADLVDDLIDDAEAYIHQGVESGMVRASADPRGRAVMLTLWSLGALVLHSHLERHLGFDITAPDITTNPGLIDYMRPTSEILGSGIYTESFAAEVQEALASTTPSPPDRARDTQGST